MKQQTARRAKRGRPKHELADIVRDYRHELGHVSPQQHKVLRDVERCRTSHLGGHVERCDDCGFERNAYNSCRNRHCPKCQSLARHRWVERRKERLLPTHYFHVVFTLPAELRQLVNRHPVAVFDLLFRAATETLSELSGDEKHLGAQLGITAILHTWTRELLFHPHLHCVVTGGGLTRDGCEWRSASKNYLFPVRVLGKLFRGKFLAGLRVLIEGGQLPETCADELAPLLSRLHRKNWVVYAKQPFGSAGHVFRYLGRYTHRIAISNHRIVEVSEEQVTFATRHSQKKSLAPAAFLRRYLQHVVPERYVRIRHDGLCAPAKVYSRLERAGQLLAGGEVRPLRRLRAAPCQDFRQLLASLTDTDLRACPACTATAMQRYPLPDARGPP